MISGNPLWELYPKLREVPQSTHMQLLGLSPCLERPSAISPGARVIKSGVLPDSLPELPGRLSGSLPGPSWAA